MEYEDKLRVERDTARVEDGHERGSGEHPSTDEPASEA